MIKLAFDCKAKPVLPLLQDNEPESEEPKAPDGGGICFQTVRAAPLSLAKCRFRLTRQWVADMKAALDPLDAHHFIELDFQESLQKLIDTQKQVDTLTKKLWARLDHHIAGRVNDTTKHSHMVWKFSRRNLSRVGAVLVMNGHVRKNLEGVVDRDGVSFLRSPNAGGYFVPLTGGVENEIASKLVGCYLFFDQELGIWIRSGMTIRYLWSV